MDRNKDALIIYPVFLKRFDVLHKWFEKYSFKNISDQRNKHSIGFDGQMIERKNKFYFMLDGSDFSSDFDSLLNNLIKNSKDIFDTYINIESLYDFLIVPVLNESKELPTVGADWIFEYLMITKMVNEEMLATIIDKIKPHVKKMWETGEPNVIEYYEKLDLIIDDIHKFQIS